MDVDDVEMEMLGLCEGNACDGCGQRRGNISPALHGEKVIENAIMMTMNMVIMIKMKMAVVMMEPGSQSYCWCTVSQSYCWCGHWWNSTYIMMSSRSVELTLNDAFATTSYPGHVLGGVYISTGVMREFLIR